jgi:RNA polymerase sigma factor (sigma-70 family)
MDVSDIEKHYLANRQKLVKRASFRTGSDNWAEDIVQETYERILKYRKSYDGDNPDKWINTILNNCIRDFKNIENGHTVDEFVEEDSDSIQCPHYSEHIMREVYELIDTKSLLSQEILTLFFKYEYTPADIEKLTTHSYSNCHKIVSRFRQELKELYGN